MKIIISILGRRKLGFPAEAKDCTGRSGTGVLSHMDVLLILLIFGIHERIWKGESQDWSYCLER